MRALLAFLVLAVPSAPAAAATSYLCVLNRTSAPATFSVFQHGGGDTLISAPAQGDACLRLPAPEKAYRVLMLGGSVRPCPAVVLKPDEWMVVAPAENGKDAACMVESEKHHGGPFSGDRTPVSLTLENRTSATVHVAFRDVLCLQMKRSELTIPSKGKVTETMEFGTGVGCSANTGLRLEVKGGEGTGLATLMVAVRETDRGPICFANARAEGIGLDCRTRDRKNNQISILTR